MTDRITKQMLGQGLGERRYQGLVLRGESYCSLDSMRVLFPLRLEGRWLWTGDGGLGRLGESGEGVRLERDGSCVGSSRPDSFPSCSFRTLDFWLLLATGDLLEAVPPVPGEHWVPYRTRQDQFQHLLSFVAQGRLLGHRVSASPLRAPCLPD